MSGRSDSIVGHYASPILDLEVVAGPGGLRLGFQGVPDHYRPRLVPTDDPARFLVHGGPIGGAEIEFEMGQEGVTLSAGPFRLVKGEPPQAPPYRSGAGLLLGELTDDPARDGVFAGLAAEVAGMTGDALQWTLEYPKHEFLRYLMARGQFIFHGSPHADIDEFAPRRTSLEIFNVGGHGNLGAVYGTDDPIWAMWFAVIDRSKLTGSIRNGVMAFDAEDGSVVRVYEFSVHHEHLPNPPLRTGMLYVLPRAPFNRIPFYPGGPLSDEWASEVPVHPVARLAIEPSDFPFSDRIGGHDDGDLIRYDQLSDEVESALVGAEAFPGGFEMRVAPTEELRAAIDEYRELSARLLPDVRRDIGDEVDGIISIRVSGPPAYLQVVERQLTRLGLLP